MEFVHTADVAHRKKGDLLVLPLWKGKGGGEAIPAVTLDEMLRTYLVPPLKNGDFKGKGGEVLYLYASGQPEPRIALLGLGSQEEESVEGLRRAYSSLSKSCLSRRIETVNLLLPSLSLKEEDMVRGIVEGLLLSNYSFRRLKHEELDEEKICHIKRVGLIGGKNSSAVMKEAEKRSHICASVHYARDLVNGNADDITPQYLAQCAHELAKNSSHVQVETWDKGRITQEGMGLLLAVSRGSAVDPALLILRYRAGAADAPHTILVGKGVTYDTGGLNLKPTGSMETMKCDMAGAAACLATIQAIAALQLPINVTAVIPATENGIDAKSFKPGDVYTSYAGKTVEMTNSDAEGRLILADAIAYACKELKPTRLIDLATLTGAIEIALGPEAAGLMSSDTILAQELLACGEITGERLWQMPLFKEYKERLKSDIADLKSWNGRAASSNVAAMFIQQFIAPSIPWAHLDIAATAYLSEAREYAPKYATGFGVRLLVELLERQS